MNRERTDTQVQQAALVKALRSLMGIWPLLAVLFTGASGIWYLSTQWGTVKGDQEADRKTLAWHASRIDSLSASVSMQEQELQHFDVRFARVEQMLSDLQTGRITAMSKLPAIPALPPSTDSAGTGE